MAGRLVDGACSRGGYAELHCTTNFSFLQGGSHPEELVTRGGRPRLHRRGDYRSGQPVGHC